MRKIICLVLAVFIIVGGLVNKTETNAENKEDIEVIIPDLQDTLDRFNQIQGMDWCHNFSVNLKIGDDGGIKRREIKALQTALVKKGFSISLEESDISIFGKSTRQAVVDFQEKYKDDILAPLGLKKGTGYVGKATLKILNNNFRCTALSSFEAKYIMLISPTTKSNGEVFYRWKTGSKQKIEWRSLGIDRIDIILETGYSKEIPIAKNISAFPGNYFWKIPDNLEAGNYSIKIMDSSNNLFAYTGGSFYILSKHLPPPIGKDFPSALWNTYQEELDNCTPGISEGQCIEDDTVGRIATGNDRVTIIDTGSTGYCGEVGTVTKIDIPSDGKLLTLDLSAYRDTKAGISGLKINGNIVHKFEGEIDKEKTWDWKNYQFDVSSFRAKTIEVKMFVEDLNKTSCNLPNHKNWIKIRNVKIISSGDRVKELN